MYYILYFLNKPIFTKHLTSERHRLNIDMGHNHTFSTLPYGTAPYKRDTPYKRDIPHTPPLNTDHNTFGAFKSVTIRLPGLLGLSELTHCAGCYEWGGLVT